MASLGIVNNCLTCTNAISEIPLALNKLAKKPTPLKSKKITYIMLSLAVFPMILSYICEVKNVDKTLQTNFLVSF